MEREKVLLVIVKNEMIDFTKNKKEEIILKWWCINELDVEFLKLPIQLQDEILKYTEPVDYR